MTQKDALSILKLGHTTFLTGAAGAGKSHVLREYIQYLKEHGITHAVTASTGIAATHIHGMTIHSWSGIGIKETMTDADIDALEEKQNVYKRYANTHVLIIDEISMLHANFLELLNRIAQSMRRNKKPFGGMQVVFCGDFFQLPPITKEALTTSVFAYASNAWKEAKPVVCYLTEQHRQDDDVLTGILNQIRRGDIDEGVWDELALTQKKRHKGHHTKLYTHNADVDGINTKEFEAIKGEERVYYMESKGKATLVESLKKNCLASEELRLKVGAKVMCIKNDPERKFMNGSLGVVASFEDDDTPVIDLQNGKRIRVQADSWRIEEDGKVKAEISQLPLKLAWAITVHKSQGMTLDAAEIDLSKAFAYGMGYVALSRLKSIEGLHLLGMNAQALAVDEQVREQDEKFMLSSEKAGEAIEKYKEEEIKKLHDAFITNCGGHVEAYTDDEEEKTDTLTKTQELLKEKKTIKEIASIRTLTEDTIIGHIEKLQERGEKIDIKHTLPAKKIMKEITDAFTQAKTTKLMPVHGLLKGKYNFHTIRLVRAGMKK
jgi:ATP-dependent exoDNAse (exonuclease V) alpha subunit